MYIFEKKICDRILYLLCEENSNEESEKYIKIINFFKTCEILTHLNLSFLKIKLEKQSKLTPKMNNFLMKNNISFSI